MAEQLDACFPVEISDKDVFQAMKDISGYLDITPSDFKEVYLKAYDHAVRRIMTAVRVVDVMTRDVVFVRDSDFLKDVAELMAKRRVSGVPVLDAQDQVVGVISERNFFREMAGGSAKNFMEVIANCLHGRVCMAAPARRMIAREIMSSPALTVMETTPVVEAADLFTTNSVNRAPVVDAEGRLIGIVTRADIVRSNRWSAP